MKNKIAIAVFFLGSLTPPFSVFAQQINETKTLLGNGNEFKIKELGYFISPGLSFGRMDNAAASMFHLRTGVVLRDEWSAGGFMNVSLNQILPTSETLSNVYMDFWSAGAFVEYTLLSKKLWHLTFPVFIGYGEIEMDSDSESYPDLGEANFFIVEPSVQMEFNLHRNCRLNLGTGYRWTTDISYRNMTPDALSGLSVLAGVKIGLFR